VLSNQPQGGFITRQPTTDGNFARDDFRSDNGFFFGNTPRRGDNRRGYDNSPALPNLFFPFGR
jgi:hypothetical protein